MRKRYLKDFKAKVAIEAVRGEKTLQELSVLYEIHPNLIAQWKKELLKNAEAIFDAILGLPENRSGASCDGRGCGRSIRGSGRAYQQSTKGMVLQSTLFY